jgi:hypothetical protein
MKTMTLCFIAMLIATSGFSQKAKADSDTTLKTYLTYSCSMHPEYVSNVEGKCPVCNMAMNLSPKERMKAETVNLYTCPMHPDVLCTKPGKCPACKTEMVEFKPLKKTKQS